MTGFTSLRRRRTSWPLHILILVLLSTLKLLRKSSRSSENGKTFSDTLKHPTASQITINIIVLLMRSITLISFWTCTCYGTWNRLLLWHSTILLTGTLCPISIFKQQLPNLEQTYTRCSPYCDRWTANSRDCAAALHLFKEVTYRMDECTKQLPKLSIRAVSGSLEQGMEFHSLQWTVVVFKCSYLF